MFDVLLFLLFEYCGSNLTNYEQTNIFSQFSQSSWKQGTLKNWEQEIRVYPGPIISISITITLFFWANKRDYINPNIAWKRIHCLDFI